MTRSGFKRGVVGGVLLVWLAGCALPPSHQTGAAVGGAFGGMAGATFDKRNPWRGGVIGAAAGALAGVTLVELSQQATAQAADSGRPVEYRMDSGRGYYYAEPIGYDGNCRRIRENVYDNNVLIRSEVLTVCREEEHGKGKYKRKHKDKKWHKHHDDDGDDD